MCYFILPPTILTGATVGPPVVAPVVVLIVVARWQFLLLQIAGCLVHQVAGIKLLEPPSVDGSEQDAQLPRRLADLVDLHCRQCHVDLVDLGVDTASSSRIGAVDLLEWDVRHGKNRHIDRCRLLIESRVSCEAGEARLVNLALPGVTTIHSKVCMVHTNVLLLTILGGRVLRTGGSG